MTPITAADVDAAGLDDWQVLARALHAHYPTGDFATGYALVQEIAEVAAEADHHPDLTLRRPARSAADDVAAAARPGPRDPPQRFHLDVWVPPAELTTRLAAALAAGGRLVDETRSPTFVVLADAEGNHACLSTATGRG